MNRSEFWELIDKTRLASSGNSNKQAELLVAELSKLSEQEILDYQETLDDLQDEAYIADLWALGSILDGLGFSDDAFTDFRAWLIGQGKDVFEKALTNPESLVDYVEPGQKIVAEILLYVAYEAYELKTGKSAETMPSTRQFKPRPELVGTLPNDQDSMLKRFPKAKEKFWDWWQNNKDKLFLT